MASHRARGQQLYLMGRYDLAARELRAALADDPNDGGVHAMLAICLAELRELPAAEEHAKTAVGMWPQIAFCHFALGCVLVDRSRVADAERSALEAVRLEPQNPDWFGLLARTRHIQRRWGAALDAANVGLQCDPEHLWCMSLRAHSLLGMKRFDEGLSAARRVLERNPEESFGHAYLGWVALQVARTREAVAHFHESLRIMSSNSYALEGLRAARSTNLPLVTGCLVGTAIVFAFWTIIVFVRGPLPSEPGKRTLFVVTLSLAVVSAVALWCQQAILTSWFRFHRRLRPLLSTVEIADSNRLGGVLLACVVWIGLAIGLQAFWPLLLALLSFVLFLPLSGVFRVRARGPRRRMLWHLAASATLALATIAAYFSAWPSWDLWLSAYLVACLLTIPLARMR
jgi:Flp pilus assembly protein TadD